MNFETNDPKIGKTAKLGVIAFMGLVLVTIAVQASFQRLHPDRESASTAEDLRDLRVREEKQLTSYRYIDRAKGTVALPIDRAMELLVKEAAEGKLPYSTKPAEIQPEGGAVVK